MPKSKTTKSNKKGAGPGVGSGNVFKDIGFTDAESANLTARCELLLKLQDTIEKKGWTQKEAARELKVSQPRIAEIMSFDTKYFSVDLLIKYLARLGVKVNFQFKKLNWK